MQVVTEAPAFTDPALQDLSAALSRGHFPRLCSVDGQTGDLIHADARALFSKLPAVTPSTVPEELMGMGLLPALPRGWAQAMQKPRYRVGREVFVETHCASLPQRPHAPWGRYDSTGPLGITHRAQLQAQDDVAFWVSLEGATALLPFAKSAVFALNEPGGLSAGGGTLSGVRVDFHDPLWKAQVCAAWLTWGAEMARLDLEAVGAARAQATWLARLAQRVRMDYAGRGAGYAGPRAASLAAGGQGVCFVQRTVVGAFLQCFARPLGFAVQYAVGRTLQRGAPHGFVVVTMRPSLERFVVDTAWGEPCTRLDVALFGPGWGHDRRIVAFEGDPETTVGPHDVALPQVTK